MVKTIYTKEIADTFCLYLAEGMSVRKACGYPGMPDKATIFRWLNSRKSFRDQYMRARTERASARFERLDDVIEDLREKKIDYQTARIEADIIKFQIGKENAPVFGDRIIHAGDGDAPIVTKDASKNDKEALARFLVNHSGKAAPAPDKDDHGDLC